MPDGTGTNIRLNLPSYRLQPVMVNFMAGQTLFLLFSVKVYFLDEIKVSIDPR